MLDNSSVLFRRGRPKFRGIKKAKQNCLFPGQWVLNFYNTCYIKTNASLFFYTEKYVYFLRHCYHVYVTHVSSTPTAMLLILSGDCTPRVSLHAIGRFEMTVAKAVWNGPIPSKLNHNVQSLAMLTIWHQALNWRKISK